MHLTISCLYEAPSLHNVLVTLTTRHACLLYGALPHVFWHSGIPCSWLLPYRPQYIELFCLDEYQAVINIKLWVFTTLPC